MSDFFYLTPSQLEIIPWAQKLFRQRWYRTSWTNPEQVICVILRNVGSYPMGRDVRQHLPVLQMYDTICQYYGFGSDPDSISNVKGRGPGSESRSGFRSAKITHKNRKKLKISRFEVLDVFFWGLKDELFSVFVGHLCPPWSGSGFRIRIRRIRNTSFENMGYDTV